MASDSPRRLALLVACGLAMAGCGGGGSPDGPTAPTTAFTSISGTVLDGAGVMVCLDTNANSACDAGESTTTAGAQGEFTLDGVGPAVPSGTAVIARFPAAGGGAAYVLKAPASAADVVSPITSLVQAGIEQGWGLQASEAAAARQLQVNGTHLYAHYLAGPSNADSDTLAAIGGAATAGLRMGIPIVVTAATSATQQYTVRLFFYFGPTNYDLRRHYSESTVPNAATGLYTFHSLAGGRNGSAPRSTATDYGPLAAWISTPAGWRPNLNESHTHASTTGSPSISIWGNGYRYINTHTDVDVRGQPIADVVRQAQDLDLNTESTLIGVNPGAISGVMPAGARARRIRVVTVGSPLSHRMADQIANVSSLAEVPAVHPIPGTPTQANTVTLGNAHIAPLRCTATASVCPRENLRVAFGAGNAVSYYLCDWNAMTATSTNCVAAGDGSYATTTALDGSTPMLSFSGVPAGTLLNVTARHLVQRNGAVYVATQVANAAVTVTTRLNRTAYEALAGALGLATPANGPVSPYVGLWAATYAGAGSGQCGHVLVDALGSVSGSCTSSVPVNTYSLDGTVSNLGAASFGSLGTGFSGTFNAASASGTWADSNSGAGGTWSATRQ